MKQLKETMKSEQVDLYFSSSDCDELHNFGAQAQWIQEIVDIPEVNAMIKYMNLLAMKGDMLPKETPLRPFLDFDLEDTRLVIVGGVPDLMFIDEWHGTGYSYSKESKLSTRLHEKMLSDFHMQHIRYENDCDPSFESLRESGVLMLHEVLSVADDNIGLFLKLWEPFIWHLLHKISREMPTVPILFTTNLASIKFDSAVVNSKYVFRINITSEKTTPCKVFPLIQDIMNMGVSVKDEIYFMKEIRR